MEHVIMVALASLFVFYAVGHAPFLRPVFRVLSRISFTLPRCPWCLPAYPALVLSVLLTPHDLVRAGVTWLAASALAGVVGSLLPDEGVVDDVT